MTFASSPVRSLPARAMIGTWATTLAAVPRFFGRRTRASPSPTASARAASGTDSAAVFISDSPRVQVPGEHGPKTIRSLFQTPGDRYLQTTPRHIAKILSDRRTYHLGRAWSL